MRRPTPLPDQGIARRDSLGVTGPYMLFLSTLQPRKNVIRLIRSFAHLVQTRDFELDLVLAGQLGWLSEPIAFAARHSAAAHRIHLLGYVNEDEAAALYTGAKFFCYPSLHEGFGLPVLEALACGAPVLASNRSSIPEVGGEVVEYFDPERLVDLVTKVFELLENPARIQQMREAGPGRAAEFSWEENARAVISIYESLK